MSLRLILFGVLGVLLLYALFTIGFPFMLALLVAILLEQPIQWMMRLTRMSRFWAASLTCSLFTAAVLGFFYLLGFKMVSELIDFWENAPDYLNEGKSLLDRTFEQTRIFYQTLPAGWAEQLQQWTEAGVQTLTANMREIVTAISVYVLDAAKTIPNLFVVFAVFVIGLYLISLSLPALYESFIGLFDKESQSKASRVLLDLRKAVFGFLFAQILISFLAYFVTLIGLLLLRVEYPLAIALLIVALDVLPVLGTSVVLVPWALYNMLAGNLSLGVGLLILLAVIMLFRRLVEPQIISNAVGINALATLVSMYVGFKLAGVVGLVLGPVIIVVYMALRRVGLLKLNIKLT
ncbi:sporulation integral membrane protein YtvI [Paenibacillus agricola]|uniref:Sporulation integral membrane protein YtvI n=1 Tax=Paenibacillus agricola TaxID=2716264 RepID=A0ABX0J8S7_9BACL|nr:sporulation integral membrane protein YtvI [Paenibacillus agricola]NHN31594.1 sporulation integral membrane protein YtvI [Paenibacillus agricola]